MISFKFVDNVKKVQCENECYCYSYSNCIYLAYMLYVPILYQRWVQRFVFVGVHRGKQHLINFHFDFLFIKFATCTLNKWQHTEDWDVFCT